MYIYFVFTVDFYEGQGIETLQNLQMLIIKLIQKEIFVKREYFKQSDHSIIHFLIFF